MELIRERQTDVCLLFFVTNEQTYAQTLVRKRTREHLFAFIGAATTPPGVSYGAVPTTHPGVSRELGLGRTFVWVKGATPLYIIILLLF